jgi:hypothetical protein
MKRGIQALALLGLTISMFSGCGLLGRRCNDCNGCNGPMGCRPCPIGWQRGGTDYGAHLSGGHCGAMGGGAGCGPAGCGPMAGHHAGQNAYAQDTQTGSGIPGPATAYPYYTVRGPRDFFANNPPNIGR